MKYQSLWWKCLAALLLLAVLLRLLCPADGQKLPGLFSSGRSGSARAAFDDAWLAGESAAPPSSSPPPEISEPLPELISLPGELLPDEAAALFPPEKYTAPPTESAPPREALPVINNLTRSRPDIGALLEEGWRHELTPDRAHILIVHTHSCEAYSAAGADAYDESDPFRTLDREKSVIRVGDVLAERLREYGFNVIHDDTLYDYPQYSGAYSRSQQGIGELLENNPAIRVVIDLHRDSASGGFRTEYVHGQEKTAQVMLLVTNGENGLYHPNWQENLKLALELQREMDVRYPGLARDLCLSPYRYNQQLCPGSLILEVGSDGNTLAEAEAGALLFAECAGEVLKDSLN
ncbi:MAG: stage II sporulation protein P [Oscillospiraceae bacterium]|nr:stage II sporulation protein P [Oscillospiraceae bacterium]